jgi:hypothetical protein
MGAMKRFAEEVSEIIGKEGEIDDQVLEISSKAMEGIDKVKKPYTSDNPEFVKHVKEVSDGSK